MYCRCKVVTVKVQTELDFKDFKRFKEKAEQQGISEYELAKEMILLCLNDNVAKSNLSFQQKLKHFFEIMDTL